MVEKACKSVSYSGYGISFHRLRLLSRNEGKIKSYGSCCDLRAWSHDTARRDNYLRQWIKTDMPTNVIPVSSLIFIVRKMTCGSKGKITPRCHPQCKSKVILESICKSCNEMKECFRNEEDFDKYFQDEEFETSHWPCETCLEALKSIKMFWTIIVEKLFRIKVSKTDDFATQTGHNYKDCVRCVAKVWQTEMIQQAMFVKNITHFLNRNAFPWRVKTKIDKYCSPFNVNLDELGDLNECKDPLKSLSRLSLKSSKGVIGVKCPKTIDSRCLSNAITNTRRLKLTPSHSRKFSKHTVLKHKTVDASCECTSLNDEIAAIKVNLNHLKEKSHAQDLEIEKLTEENASLKLKLQNVYNNQRWNNCSCAPSTVAPENCYNLENLPKPFDDDEENCFVAPIKRVDSEIIITMKNCKNESYKHISLLQVLHKTNALEESNSNDSNCKKEDPLLLLTKLQSKFGSIMTREMRLVDRKNACIDIDADYHKMNGCKSDTSCSKTTLTNTDSGFDFKGAQYDKRSIGRKSGSITLD